MTYSFHNTTDKPLVPLSFEIVPTTWKGSSIIPPPK